MRTDIQKGKVRPPIDREPGNTPGTLNVQGDYEIWTD
jgi:hypothetical protein